MAEAGTACLQSLLPCSDWDIIRCPLLSLSHLTEVTSLVFNLLGTRRLFGCSGNPLLTRIAGRTVFAKASCLILWNKAFELKKLSLVARFDPADMLCVQVALLFPCCAVHISNLKLNCSLLFLPSLLILSQQ